MFSDPQQRQIGFAAENAFTQQELPETPANSAQTAEQHAAHQRRGSAESQKKSKNDEKSFLMSQMTFGGKFW
jgi:hypothetical protein